VEVLPFVVLVVVERGHRRYFPNLFGHGLDKAGSTLFIHSQAGDHAVPINKYLAHGLAVNDGLPDGQLSDAFLKFPDNLLLLFQLFLLLPHLLLFGLDRLLLLLHGCLVRLDGLLLLLDDLLLFLQHVLLLHVAIADLRKQTDIFRLDELFPLDRDDD
jgi:hypothetical protein